MRIKFTQESKASGANIFEEQMTMKRIQMVQTKRKVQQFATFIPDEVLQVHRTASSTTSVHHFVGVLLCVDISSILQTIEQYHKSGLGELYKISVSLNAHIGAIIEVLRSYGGDVLTIFSNGFVTLWKVLPEESMYEILHTVVVCASLIQKMLGTYVDSDANVSIKLKTAISCGNVALGVTGDSEVQQFVIVGNALDSLRNATKLANYGDIVVTGSAWPHMLQERYTVSINNQNDLIRILKISYKSSEVTKKAYFDEKYVTVVSLIEKHYQQGNLLRTLLLSSRQLTNTKVVEKFVKQLPPRVEIKMATHFWEIEEMKPMLNEVVFVHITETQPVEYLTEVREVTSLCLSIIPMDFDTAALINSVNTVVYAVIENIKQLYCTITSVNISDTEILINIIFGLVMINHENESFNSLRFAFKMKTLFDEMSSIAQVSAGISSGIVYCGVIGHPLRREYAIIGRPVIKANCFAHLFPNKVTCDYNIFNLSKLSSLHFKVVSESKVDNESMLFEYNERFDTTEDIVLSKSLINRQSDFNLLAAMIQNPSIVGFSGICLEGPAMIGKTKLLIHMHEKLMKKDCVNVFVSLSYAHKYPYYCISEVYSQIFDQVSTVLAHETILDLPRVLLTFNKSEDVDEDVALQKYRTLNRFRDIINFSQLIIVLFIDNIHFIDVQSWEILDLTFPHENLRLLMAGVPSNAHWDLRRKFVEHADIKLKEVLPLKTRYITPLVCTLLNVEAVSRRLMKLLEITCEGNPGYIECCLLRQMNNGTIEMKFCSRDRIDTETFCFADIEQTQKIETIFPVLEFSTPGQEHTEILTMGLIYLDLFDSFTPFQQLVVKTASLLGLIFGRTLLMVCLNYPSGNLLAEALMILFDERVFECGSRFVTGKGCNPSVICCRCYFEDDFFTSNRKMLPRYAYCKLIHFRNENLRDVAYNRIPANQRRELHVLCAEIIEKMEHVCPNCIRNPANLYANFGKYKEFLNLCSDPSNVPDYYAYVKDSYENIKETITAHKFATLKKESDKEITLIDEKYKPVTRNYDPTACKCLEMLHVIYQDLVVHATQAQEFGKMIFYKLKFGLIQLCMRDIIGAMKTLQETRELCLVNVQTDDCEINEIFRHYHVGKASIGLAICNIKIKNINAAKNNVLLALRQYNVPLVTFTFKHFKLLLRRHHFNLHTLRPYNNRKSVFRWELGIGMLVCAKIFAMENDWSYAKDCCKYGIALVKAVNNNMHMLMDIFCDAIEIYRKSGDNSTCERLQMFIIREFEAKYTENDTSYFYALNNFLDIVLDVHVAKGNIKKPLRLGYRFLHLQDISQIADTNPEMLMLLCELNIYTLSFRDFIDVFTIMTRRLYGFPKEDKVLHYLMGMFCYNYTGFSAIKFEVVLEFAEEYILNKTKLSENDIALKLLINVQFLRRGRYDRARKWEVSYDYINSKLSSSKVIKIMLFQMEGYLLRMARYLGNLKVSQDLLLPKIQMLFKLMKKAISHNLMYKPAYLCLWAWYLILSKRKFKAKSLLKTIYETARQYENQYYMAFVGRVKNYWSGGFLHDYESRPHVPISLAPTYTFEQFTQFLHPFIIK